MKLSDAISLGSMLNPQAVGAFYDARGSTCAWASALEATGLSVPDKEWSWTRRPTNCPECHGKTLRVVDAIIHLNDFHRWSRYQIAEWISRIEPTDETSSSGEEFSCVA